MSAFFLLDGEAIPFEEGDSVLAAARRAGHYIPHLCWDARFPPHGSCKLCVVEIAGRRNWATVACQPNIVVDLPDLGPISTHPDIVYGDNGIDDVKTAKRAKADEPTLELGFYAIAVEAFSGEPVPNVGYLTWVRVTRPYWQEVNFPVTDELRRWTRERAGSYIRAKKADELLNRKAEMPRNFSFPGGPAFRSLCADCQYAPVNGGECGIAYRGEATA